MSKTTIVGLVFSILHAVFYLAISFEDINFPFLSIVGFASWYWLERYCVKNGWLFSDFISNHPVLSVLPLTCLLGLAAMVWHNTTSLVLAVGASMVMLPACLAQLAFLVLLVNGVKHFFGHRAA